ncbi:hypothetical protein [Chryseolinea sp. H1M3-3]|uniref:hypothetical protein n=1 Tax=Chryseolinea sp. H1M3-3 TaxID=3034144 RepID=UPI0023ED0ADF|nr:hypothetical protein [Chryseolinea sp. H1M3-3]
MAEDLVVGNSEEPNHYLLKDSKETSTYSSISISLLNVTGVTTSAGLHIHQKVIDEFQRLYQEAGAQFEAIHMAGDEYHRCGKDLLSELHSEMEQARNSNAS